MTMTLDQVAQLFSQLETGDPDAFFAHAADDVRWTVMGTHPLAGEYWSKGDFRWMWRRAS